MSTVSESKPWCAMTSAENELGIDSHPFTTASPRAQIVFSVFSLTEVSFGSAPMGAAAAIIAARRWSVSGSAHGLDESEEEPARRVLMAYQLLRMPLHADDEPRRVLQLDGLDELIGRPGDRAEAAAERLHRLMVHAVHVRGVRAHDRREPAVRGDLHRVGGLVARLLLAVHDGSAGVAADVLMQAA